MKITRTRAGRALLATGLAAAVLAGGLAPAAPAAASAGCDFTMVSLEARNLQTDNGKQKDYVWLRLEDRWFPSGGDGVSFTLGQTKYPSAFGYPEAGFLAGGLEVRLVLDKWPGNVTVERETIACNGVTNATTTFSNGDAIYDLVYTVTE